PPPRERALSPRVPQTIQSIYHKALKVRHEPDSFAVKVRHALEAICKDQGERGRLADALSNLSKKGLFPPIIAEIAKEIRIIGNTGAHGKSGGVEMEQVQAID